MRQHEPFVEIRTDHLCNPLALLMDPPLRPFFPLQRYYLWVRVNDLVLGLGAMRRGHAALELAKEVGDFPEHLLVGEHLVHSRGFAHAIREIGREFVETNHVAQQRIEEGTKVLGSECGGSLECWVDEDEHASSWREFDESIDED